LEQFRYRKDWNSSGIGRMEQFRYKEGLEQFKYGKDVNSFGIRKGWNSSSMGRIGTVQV
jgi:hypothetical protein